MNELSVKVGSYTMRGWVHGRGEPLVLVHGQGSWWYEWRYMIRRLGRYFRVYAMDQIGFGSSDAPIVEYRPDFLANNLVELLNVLDLERVAIVAGSSGGFPVALAALKCAARLKGAAFLGTPFYPARNAFNNRVMPNFARDVMRWYQEPGRHPRTLHRWPRTLERHFTQTSAKRRRGATARFVHTWFGAGRFPAITSTFYPYPADLLAQYAATKTPTFFLYGSKDIIVDKAARAAMMRKCPHAHLEVIKCGHGLSAQRPKLTADRVIEFFRR